VTVSTCEAEYVAAGIATREAIWMTDFLDELQMYGHRPLRITTDSQSALRLITNPVLHNQTKHIRIANHFVREKVKEKFVRFKFCTTGIMATDFLTKSVPREKFDWCCTKLGILILKKGIDGKNENSEVSIDRDEDSNSTPKSGKSKSGSTKEV
jgi:hypothetical protein